MRIQQTSNTRNKVTEPWHCNVPNS